MDSALQEWLYADDNPNEEIEALIRLRDITKTPQDVRVITQFDNIITCRVRRNNIVAVRANPNVISFKAARIISATPWTDDTEDTGYNNLNEDAPQSATSFSANNKGRGVVIGFLDWGADFAHQDFVNQDGTTRFLAIWDQGARISSNNALQPYGYGKVYNQTNINAALRTTTPYTTLGYRPSPDAHGTHVMGIACSNGSSGVLGTAPEADIVFVNLNTSDSRGLQDLGDSVRLLEGIDFIKNIAGDRPLVINMSVGMHGGSHDGKSLIEIAMDNFLANRRNTAICQSVGNYYSLNTHSSGKIMPGGANEFEFNVKTNDPTPNELEIWYSGRDIFEIVLSNQSANVSISCTINQNQEIRKNNQLIGRIYHRSNEPNNGMNHIDIFIYANAPKGKWKITLKGIKIVDGRYHSWIERDYPINPNQATFEPNVADKLNTNGTICNGFNTIVVGAYNHNTNTIPDFSSSGPTIDGRNKPDILAPGYRINSSRSAANTQAQGANNTLQMSGTSMAAPHVTGTVATLLSETTTPLNIFEIKALLLQSVDNFPTTNAHDLIRRGGGKLNVDKAVMAVRQHNQQPLINYVTVQASPILPIGDQAEVGERTDNVTIEDNISVGNVILRSNTARLLIAKRSITPDNSFGSFDEALAFAFRQKPNTTIIEGNPLSSTIFNVFTTTLEICPITPYVIESNLDIAISAIVFEGLTAYFPENIVQPTSRWIQMPRLNNFYGQLAAFKQRQLSVWRQHLNRNRVTIILPNINVTEIWINHLSVPALVLLIARFPSFYNIRDFRNGVVLNGTTSPVFNSPISEPDCYLSVIARSEGRIESINAWDAGAGISLGPIQFNAQRGSLLRFLWLVWQHDNALFIQHFGRTLNWSMTELNNNPVLVVTEPSGVTRFSLSNIAQFIHYLHTGHTPQTARTPQFVALFRRDLTNHFIQIVVFPHIQEFIYQVSTWWLQEALHTINSTNNIAQLDITNLDRDTFVLRALLHSAHVRYSGYTRFIINHLSQYSNSGTKLRHIEVAINRIANTEHRTNLISRVRRQITEADEVFNTIRQLPIVAGNSSNYPVASGYQIDLAIDENFNPTYHGHSVKGDYPSGIILEDIKIMSEIVKTPLVNEDKSQLFFTKGTPVTLITSKGLWVHVSGQASYKEKGKLVPHQMKVDGKIIPTIGRVDRIYTDMPLGKFNNIEIIDTSKYKRGGETVRFGKESLSNYKFILMHKTEGSLGSVNSTYKNRVNSGSNVGSHYLIDDNGKIFLTAGIDEKLSHTKADIDPVINNSHSIGIEHVGFAVKIINDAKKTFKDRISEIRDQLGNLSLSPEFKKMLLRKEDSALVETLRNHSFMIHNDISAEQKRASYLLTKNLRLRFSLGINAIKAHEESAIKTIGEGENTVEFHQTIEEYPFKIKILEELINNSQFSNVDIKTILGNVNIQSIQLNQFLINEKMILDAILRDGTHEENFLLKEYNPEAQKREDMRIQFYKNFYYRMDQINQLINALDSMNLMNRYNGNIRIA